MSQLALSSSFHYLWYGYRHYKYIQCGTFRRHNLTSMHVRLLCGNPITNTYIQENTMSAFIRNTFSFIRDIFLIVGLVSIVGSLRDRELAYSASDRQGPNFESCVWRTVSSQSSHHPQEVLMAQFSIYVHKGGLKPDSFHLYCRALLYISYFFSAGVRQGSYNYYIDSHYFTIYTHVTYRRASFKVAAEKYLCSTTWFAAELAKVLAPKPMHADQIVYLFRGSTSKL